MAIKAKFNMDDIKKRMSDFLDEVEQAEIERLQKLGEDCVKHARNIAPPDAGKEFYTEHILPALGRTLERALKSLNSGYIRKVSQIEAYSSFDFKI
jgi:hypothetical protein